MSTSTRICTGIALVVVVVVVVVAVVVVAAIGERIVHEQQTQESPGWSDPSE